MKLKSGEVICPKCKGKKKIKADYSLNNPDTFIWVEGQKVACDKCLGTGKLDWIENMVGGKQKPQEINNKFYSEKIIERVANEISKNIDKDILESLKEGSK